MLTWNKYCMFVYVCEYEEGLVVEVAEVEVRPRKKIRMTYCTHYHIRSSTMNTVFLKSFTIKFNIHL